MTNEELIEKMHIDPYEFSEEEIQLIIGALEKQVAKKPDEKDEYFIDVDWVCPTCGELYNQDHYSAYCPSCGQKIDWG